MRAIVLQVFYNDGPYREMVYNDVSYRGRRTERYIHEGETAEDIVLQLNGLQDGYKFEVYPLPDDPITIRVEYPPRPELTARRIDV